MPDEDDQPTPAPADDLGDAGRKAIKAERDRAAAAERSLRAKEAELADATSRLTAFESQITDLTKQVTDRDLANTRLTVGLEKGLPKAFIERLRGTTPEEIAADADELVQLIPAAAPAAAASTTPKADPSQGARGPGKPTPAEEFAAAMAPQFNNR
jgi:hypothetical protein